MLWSDGVWHLTFSYTAFTEGSGTYGCQLTGYRRGTVDNSSILGNDAAWVGDRNRRSEGRTDFVFKGQQVTFEHEIMFYFSNKQNQVTQLP